ncbi:HK97 gp10 family phage protein [Aerococcus kribbianus]|uniref:HK97 gp10 family phage protein n=1 Tax=Aerococcus kribbianus TaxID=2999064 RepID=A0A9X3JH00_9LACT|nr:MULTISPECIES: HK97 gp10 family phage protein [unclassified Aerococcus]MCZ0717832.1 HK97 gp10 family phage protein [Aerococcus sp. YH-aer221]MCZ0726119.1 HK97 gp10 family phage protein [Aerococcus sp. YH-aer222]
MSINIKGLDKVLKNMEKELGERKISRVQNKAIREAGEPFKEGLKKAVNVYADYGYTRDEVVISDPRKQADGKRKAKVGWNGPHQRYRLVHLNEFGYTRWNRRYSPPGKGVIRNYIDGAESIFLSDVKDSIMKQMDM